MPREKVRIPAGEYDVVGRQHGSEIFIIAVPALAVETMRALPEMDGSLIEERIYAYPKQTQDAQKQLNAEHMEKIYGGSSLMEMLKVSPKAELPGGFHWNSRLRGIMRLPADKPEDIYIQEYSRPPLDNPPDWVDEEVRESPRDRDNRIIDGG